MNGNEFCNILKSELSAENQSQLSRLLGVSPASLAIMKKRKNIGSRQVTNFIKRIVDCGTASLLKTSIRPIVEYFPIDAVLKRSRWYPFDDKEHGNLARVLRSTNGIYAYYNSEGKLIYLGKTSNNLFSEMVQTFNREFDSYFLFAVRHPRDRYKPDPNGKLRKIPRMSASLADTASFFSCYAVSDELIGPLEAFVIRLCANNLINSRMEASLSPVGIPTPSVKLAHTTTN